MGKLLSCIRDVQQITRYRYFNDPVAKFEVGGEFPNVKTHRPINEGVDVAADGNSKNSVKKGERKESTKDEYMGKKLK